MNIIDVWESAKKEIRDEITSVSYDLWIKTLIPDSFENGSFNLLANTSACKNMVLKNHIALIADKLKKQNPKITQVIIWDSIDKEKQFTAPAVPTKVITNNFNQRFTFDNFIVGKSNEFVYAAVKNVAENPSGKINPLFFYGGSGLGKTHLLNAIGNYLEQARPELRVILSTCEKFTNTYLETLHNKNASITAFRENYRNCDVLLIDDMQFISNKTSTQEEFFNTFNDLYNLGKQIVITSDRHPNEIKTLEDRMRSRFVGGIVQDIQQPDVEMRIVILQKKAEQNEYKIEKEVIEFLAETAAEQKLNIRDMEGLLNKVVFYSGLLRKKSPSIADAKEAIKDNQEKRQVQTTCDVILDKVCSYFNIDKSNIIGKKRNKEFIEPRMVTVYLITELLNIPLISIGEFLGGRDHSTILHSKNKITQDLKTNKRIKTAVDDITLLITES